jgi:hypothetical protein
MEETGEAQIWKAGADNMAQYQRSQCNHDKPSPNHYHFPPQAAHHCPKRLVFYYPDRSAIRPEILPPGLIQGFVI